ncbi:hypothetical protein CWM47_36610 [Spirosoma pollinicola]|uniref:Uncharacterized protein n=1 Tax=Spirosoma pollinicola TaxID=2057025 RepID=A0A2K8ZAK7_9BACT|nr:hypothetical protein [Spirosoma pollinicola]AUD06885.1 hypothetical protein CWM47_36610 [Spirosoma pollinicola]
MNQNQHLRNTQLGKLGLDCWITGFMCVEGHKRSVAIATAIPLSAITGLAETLNLLSMATMLTNNCF